LRFGTWARWASSVTAKFFERLDHARVLRRVVWARADVGKADLLQELPDRALVIIDAEALANDLLQIDAPPAHHAIDGPVGTRLDDGRQGGELIGRQPGRLSRGANVLQPVGAAFVEPVDPVAQCLAIHAADPRGCSRSIPSRAAANNRSRRLWLACFDPAASGRRSKLECVRSFTAAAMARILLAPMELAKQAAEKTPVSQPRWPLIL
jgi:hypothetical protein